MNANTMKVLVTGATGFLGAHVVQAFLSEGASVIATHRQCSDTWRLNAIDSSQNNLIHETVDLASKATIDNVISKHHPDVIVNCAAYGVDYRQQDCEQAIQTNITAVSWLIDVANKHNVSRFVQVGTCYEYGGQSGSIKEGACLHPQGIYGVTKAAGTLLALDRAKALGLPLVVLRPFGMYGPLEGGHKFVPMLLEACKKNEAIELTHGDQLRDYLYVGDATSAIVTIAGHSDFPQGEIFNVASGVPVKLREFGGAIHTLINQGSLNWGAKPYRPDEIMSVVANIDKLTSFIGWQPSVSLEQGLSLSLKEIESREEAIR